MMKCFGFIFFMECQLPQAAPPLDTFCQNYKPVYWSATDTRQTKEQVDANNRVWKSLCSKPGAKK